MKMIVKPVNLRILKKIFVLLALTSGVLYTWGQNSENTMNLLKKWRQVYAQSGEGTTIIQPDGIIACENKTDNDYSGVEQSVLLDQKEAHSILFSAESKAEDVSGNPERQNYAVYLDIVYADDTKLWGLAMPFQTGTHDFEKVSFTYMPTPGKPIKSLKYYLILRKKTGKVWFRNAILIELKK